ncbi:hypothetical protein ES708_25262 [subsurface metagenome]
MRSFKSLSIVDDFNKANAIFIKPNLTYPKFKKGVTTRVEHIESLVATLRQINDTTKIYIGEGEGGYNSFSMTEAMQSMGFYEFEKPINHKIYKKIKFFHKAIFLQNIYYYQHLNTLLTLLSEHL